VPRVLAGTTPRYWPEPTGQYHPRVLSELGQMQGEIRTVLSNLPSRDQEQGFVDQE
jgi:hypothetical protein